MDNPLKVLFFTLILLFFIAPPLKADIYKYIDSNGVLHFTNIPISSGYQLYIKEKPEEVMDISDDMFDHYISEASRFYGLDFFLIKAMIKVESDFNPRAVSKKGAKGLMQIMPFNFDQLRIVDPFDPKENIMGGSMYIKQLLLQYKGRLPLALAAYNAGPNAVNRYKRIPPYRETENYVKKVMKHYNVLKTDTRGL
jgi:membrane-bound lytic murein transglycosylase MltF